MNFKSLTLIVFIALTLGISASTVVSNPVYATTDTDRCVSEEGEDEFGDPVQSSTCADKSLEGSKELMKQYKEDCKKGDNKCSSSQTGFGEFGNWYKKGEVELKDK